MISLGDSLNTRKKDDKWNDTWGFFLPLLKGSFQQTEWTLGIHGLPHTGTVLQLQELIQTLLYLHVEETYKIADYEVFHM